MQIVVLACDISSPAKAIMEALRLG
jgi:hypothetical protein